MCSKSKANLKKLGEGSKKKKGGLYILDHPNGKSTVVLSAENAKEEDLIFEGTVVFSTFHENEIGKLSSNWHNKRFRPFYGEIKLSM